MKRICKVCDALVMRAGMFVITSCRGNGEHVTKRPAKKARHTKAAK